MRVSQGRGRMNPYNDPPEKKALTITAIIAIGLAGILMLIMLLIILFFVISCGAAMQGAGVGSQPAPAQQPQPAPAPASTFLLGPGQMTNETPVTEQHLLSSGATHPPGRADVYCVGPSPYVQSSMLYGWFFYGTDMSQSPCNQLPL